METKAPSTDIFQAKDAKLPTGWIEKFTDEFFQSHGTGIHLARNQIKIFDINGQSLNIKKYCIPPVVNRFIYSLGIRRPKAKTTFVNALEIRRRGFNTPQPYGYMIKRRGGLINYSYFFSEQLIGVKRIEHHCTDKKLIAAVARFTADLHEKGLLHIDYTAHNILYREENGKYTFYLVDINRFKFRDGPWPVSAVLSNLMKPFENDEMLTYFVQEYATCRGADPNIVKKVLRWRHFRNLYNKVKRLSKKIPGANLLLNKPLSKKK